MIDHNMHKIILPAHRIDDIIDVLQDRMRSGKLRGPQWCNCKAAVDALEKKIEGLRAVVDVELKAPLEQFKDLHRVCCEANKPDLAWEIMRQIEVARDPQRIVKREPQRVMFE